MDLLMGDLQPARVDNCSIHERLSFHTPLLQLLSLHLPWSLARRRDGPDALLLDLGVDGGVQPKELLLERYRRRRRRLPTRVSNSLIGTAPTRVRTTSGSIRSIVKSTDGRAHSR